MSIAAETAAAIDAIVNNPCSSWVPPRRAGGTWTSSRTPAEYNDISASLADAGFLRWRQTWAKFDGRYPS